MRVHQTIGLAAVLNFGLTVVEVGAFFLTNSLTVGASALHDVGDCFLLLASYAAEKLSLKRPDRRRTFGYRRLSIVAAFFNALVLLGGSLVIIGESIRRLIMPEVIETAGLVWLAGAGLMINGFLGWRLSRGHSLNERVISWHFFEDFFGWLGILFLAAAGPLINRSWVDPLIAIIFAAIVFANALRNLIKILNILLEGTPSDISLPELISAVKKVEGVTALHDIHCWTTDNLYHCFTAHIVVDEQFWNWEDCYCLKNSIKRLLEENGVPHSTLELERSHSCSLGTCLGARF